MSDVWIVGAGGFGREVLQYAQDAEESGQNIHVVGFLDSNVAALEGFAIDLPVVDPSKRGVLLSGNVVIALGDPTLRAATRQTVDAAGGTLISVVHPTAWVAATAQIEAGCIVAPGAFVSANAHLARNAVVNVFASVGHDCRVGVDTVLSPHVALSGAAVMGDAVLCGTHVTVTPGVSVGDYARLAAGACITRDVPPGALAAGNPARSRVMYRVAE